MQYAKNYNEIKSTATLAKSPKFWSFLNTKKIESFLSYKMYFFIYSVNIILHFLLIFFY